MWDFKSVEGCEVYEKNYAKTFIVFSCFLIIKLQHTFLTLAWCPVGEPVAILLNRLLNHLTPTYTLLPQLMCYALS